jgi:hypothetical protein
VALRIHLVRLQPTPEVQRVQQLLADLRMPADADWVHITSTHPIAPDGAVPLGIEGAAHLPSGESLWYFDPAPVVQLRQPPADTNYYFELIGILSHERQGPWPAWQLNEMFDLDVQTSLPGTLTAQIWHQRVQRGQGPVYGEIEWRPWWDKSRISISGLQHPHNAADLAVVEEGLRLLAELPNSREKHTGAFTSREECRTVLLTTMRAWRGKNGRAPSQRQLGTYLPMVFPSQSAVDQQQIDRWVKHWGLDWADLKREAQHD